MKKMFVLALALVFVLSGAVMADYTGVFVNPYDYDDSDDFGAGGDYENYAFVDDTGIVYFNEVDSQNPGDYTNLESLNRAGYTLDEGSDQSVKIRIPVEAYIPCYLEMKLTGNQGTTALQSFGDGAHGDRYVDGYLMVFDNEIGGFLGGADGWQSLGYGQNVELDMTQDVFIGACDIFAVEVTSNTEFEYGVASKALENSAGDYLDMIMRTDRGDNGWDAEDTFTGTTVSEEYSVTDIPAGNSEVFIHNFKVPYSFDTIQGKYTGEVVFRAATI